MKTKLSVTTVIEITGVETSWAIGEALKKAFKDVAHVNDELTDDDAQGYSFTFHGNPTIDSKGLDGFESKVKKIIKEAHAKELAEEAEREARAKKNMEGFTGSKLTPFKNKYALMMDEVIKSFDARVIGSMKNKEFHMAECTWNDVQDLITLRMLLETKTCEEAYKYARNLDTFVRDCIPGKVYEYLTNGED